MPEFPLIDAHVHLYDPARIAYPWLEGVPAIGGAHLPRDYRAACGEVGVERMVFAEVDAAEGQGVAEARFAAALAGEEPRLAGLIACARVERGAAVAEEVAALAESGLVRGIRRLIQDRPPGFCVAGGFVEGVRRLADFGLPFDLCIRHHQMGEAIALARACPEVGFVLDHLGKPPIAAGALDPWRGEIGELARLPNVCVKISGVLSEAGPGWSVAAIRPYVAHAIECFGFGRALFGGDWPVVDLIASLPAWVGALDALLAGASAAERRALYRDNAARVYRLAPASGTG